MCFVSIKVGMTLLVSKYDFVSIALMVLLESKYGFVSIKVGMALLVSKYGFVGI